MPKTSPTWSSQSVITAKEVKNGTVIEVYGAPHMVESVVKQAPSARGASTIYKIRARNLLTGGKADQSCRGDDVFPQPHVEFRAVQYLYRNGGMCCFIDIESYEQLELAATKLEEQLPYMIEDMEGLSATILEGHLVAIQLPDTVEMQVSECAPAVKGASATARTKPATMPSGLVVQVPEYLAQDEVIRIDTRTGKFLSRA